MAHICNTDRSSQTSSCHGGTRDKNQVHTTNGRASTCYLAMLLHAGHRYLAGHPCSLSTGHRSQERRMCGALK
jgi:hypothetical protein